MGSIEAQVVSDITLPNHIPESAQTPSQAPVPRLFSLEGRTIAITGAGRGVGINLAAAVLEAGGHAACIDVLPEPSPVEWASLQKLAKSSNLTISYHKCDITSEESISGTLDTIAKEALEVKAPLHGTIACAGIQQKAPAVDYPIDGFRRIMEVNVTGTFLTIKHSARIFMEQKIPGSIVMIASMSGQVANRVEIKSRFGENHSRILGIDLHGVQLFESRGSPDVSVCRSRMGPAWHSREYNITWIHQDCDDRRITCKRARLGEDVDGWSSAGKTWCA